MRWSPFLALLVVAALSGCATVQPGDASSPDGLDDGDSLTTDPGRTSGRSGTRGPSPFQPSGGAGNGTGDGGNATAGNATVERTWATLGSATIRPGVQIHAGGSQCTSNFVFTSPDNRTVYLGFAAHCVTENDPNSADDGCDPVSGPWAVGAKLEVEGADHPARLAYTSWGTMQDEGESGGDECRYNDFALAELDPRDAAKVNPAMLFFGGPTAMADPGDVSTLDKVMTYGDSGLRGGIAALSPHEGYVVFTPGDGGWSTDIYTLPQGIPGDSGSGVLLSDGAALGVLVTISYAGGSNGVTTLANAMEYAAASGVPVRLATADLIEGGYLPPV